MQREWSQIQLTRPKVLVRGAGDLATGVIQALVRSGAKVLALEVKQPSAIRRSVALSEAIYRGHMRVEDIEAKWIDGEAKDPRLMKDIEALWAKAQVPVLVDPQMQSLAWFEPDILVDAILAKKNLGLKSDLAPLTIALGPGFSAPKDADLVIETMRGHQLGRLIFEGSALPNTGLPGLISGRAKERVLYTPFAGRFMPQKKIGDWVQEGECIAYVEAIETPEVRGDILAPFEGLVRGLLPEGYLAPEHMKCGDIDPRTAEKDNCFTISDKARALGHAVVTGIWALRYRPSSRPRGITKL